MAPNGHKERFRFVHANTTRVSEMSVPEFTATLNRHLSEDSVDLMALPRDNSGMGQVVLQSPYENFLSRSSGSNTMLLYNSKHIAVKEGPDISTPQCFNGIDVGQIACPVVNLFYGNERDPFRSFMIITWNHDMVTSRPEQVESLISFAQITSIQHKMSLILAGEFDLHMDKVNKIMNNLNSKMQEQVMNECKQEAGPEFLPFLLNGSLREPRHQFKLKMHHASDGQFFLASKDMMFDPPKVLTEGGQINHTNMTSRPAMGPELPPKMKTEQKRPSIQADLHMRPPPSRHHGG